MTTSYLCNLYIALLLVTLIETRAASVSNRSNRSPPGRRIRSSNDEKGESDGSQELPRSSMHFSVVVVEGDEPRSGLSSNSALMIMAGVAVVLFALCYCCVNADAETGPDEGHAQPCSACAATENNTAARQGRRQPLEIKWAPIYLALNMNTGIGASAGF